ncbi:hypothetical protein HMPREF1544_12057 [Mucor circinelloides 1006PhL]|uniref:Manganese transporter n=1 Tax=Mucor circinelloides f. circinelloides (strain 1006PhL) TaxID=1220926 RepID=S2IVB1_MUCC1|nr:hypothetical protein HMPREF1544_12057 [Mucor circinelloides 1006PhL]
MIKSIQKVKSYLKTLGRFIGPGFMIAVGYLDPGNWATDMEGGSSYGYRLLFIILLSNLIAVFLQNLTIRLGTISGLDLASASRRYFPRWLNLFLYVLAECAIIATDIAEVIGSAIALNLLFPKLPLPAGVAITAVDVFIILMFYTEEADDPDSSATSDSASVRMVRFFEMFVMMLVAAVGICFIIELAYSDIVAVDVFKGFLPTKEIFTNPEILYVAIGIIGATVMPHNLYLHSFIVQSYLDTSLKRNLHYGFVDLIVALSFAFFVNCAILIVAAANFYYGPDTQQQQVQDLFSAHALLMQYLGPPAAVTFALALLCAGQSSTLTATLAGQVVMSGFLGMTTRPWIRRIVTRLIAIIPAMVAACVAGREGLSSMLVGSQVALSIQLPFAVVPLVYFTARKQAMKLELVVQAKNMDPDPVTVTQQEKMSLVDRTIARFRFSSSKSDWFRFPQFSKMNIDTVKNYCIKSDHATDATGAANAGCQGTSAAVTPAIVVEEMDQWPEPLTYANGKIVNVVAVLISLLLIGLNGYLVVSLFMSI